MSSTFPTTCARPLRLVGKPLQRKTTDTDASRKRFMEAHTFRDGRTLEDAYQASIRQKQEHDTAFMNRASELRNEYDRLRQGVEQQEKQ